MSEWLARLSCWLGIHDPEWIWMSGNLYAINNGVVNGHRVCRHCGEVQYTAGGEWMIR